MESENSRVLIVEGHDDKHCVIHLMKNYVPWSKLPESHPVNIVVGNSASEILDNSYLAVQLKAASLHSLGVMLDADVNPRGRYESFRNCCHPYFPMLPREMPAEGLVVENSEHRRLGLWIMSDNVSEGHLETFLIRLVKPEALELWGHADESTSLSRQKGANWKYCHAQKAVLYTFLAWQDPPGHSPGIAITKRVLDPLCNEAVPFVKWFRDLYRL